MLPIRCSARSAISGPAADGDTEWMFGAPIYPFLPSIWGANSRQDPPDRVDGAQKRHGVLAAVLTRGHPRLR
jgi:hypothetical protein